MSVAQDGGTLDWYYEQVGSGAFANAKVGQWVLVVGFGNAANNGYKKIKAVPSADRIDVFDTLTAEAAGASVLIKGSCIQNGVTVKSFSLEKVFSDLSPVQYLSYLGCLVNSMNLNVETGAIMGGTFNFRGIREERATATIGTGSPVVAGANSVQNSIDNIKAILENGIALTGVPTQLSFTVNNNLRPRPALGVLGSSSIGLGRMSVEGTLRVYLADGTQLDKYHDWVTSALSFRLEDSVGVSLVFDFPAIKFTNAAVVAGAIDQDVLVDLSFGAQRDPDTDKTLTISRFD